MINLFFDNRNEILKTIVDDYTVFTIKKSLDENIFIDNFDFKSKVKIVLEEGVNVSILEKDSSNGNVEYILKNDSYLNHNLLVLNQGNKSERHILLEEGASWIATCADLSMSSNSMKIQCDLLGKYSTGKFHLSALSKDDSKKVFDINFTHFAPNSESKMENYGVCRNSSSLSFPILIAFM